MGDRIAVLNAGVIQQLGTPGELYEHPANKFVAGFIGSPAMNFFEDGRLEQQEGRVWLRLAEGVALILPEEVAARAEGYVGRQVTAGTRPEHLEEGQVARRRQGVEAATALTGQTIPVQVEVVEHLGNEQMVYGLLAGKQVLARVDARTALRPGDEIELFFDLHHLHLFDPANDRSITSQPSTSTLELGASKGAA